MVRKGKTGRLARFDTRSPLLVILPALALIAAVPAAASAPAAVSTTPIAAATARTVTLITGDQVMVTTSHGRPSALLMPATGTGPAVRYEKPGGDQYIVPAVAKPYLGRQLDPSLFDVSALLRENLTTGARIPVSLRYAAGATPSAPPGITLTSVGGATASGYLTPASAASFTAGLRASIGADVRAGRRAGTGALFGGVTGMSLAAGAPSGVVTPHYPMHQVNIELTDTAGKPVQEDEVYFEDLDNLLAGYAEVPVDDGVGRVTLPAGHYLATSQIFDFNADGDMTAIHWIDHEVIVPSTATTTTVKLSEAEATSAITVRTPRPSTQQGLSVANYFADTLGLSGSIAILGLVSEPAYVNPMAKPAVGSVRFQVSWSGVGPATGPAYRYDVAFGSDGVPANQSYVVRPSQLAAVKQNYHADPAGGPTGWVFHGAYDQDGSAVPVAYGLRQAMPATVTDYLGTADSGVWGNAVVTPNQALVNADNRTFTPGQTGVVDWVHGPLAPTIGQHTGPHFCYACTAGTALDLVFYPVGDSEPDQVGTLNGGSYNFAFYRNGTLVSDESGIGIAADNINTGPATYRGVYTGDASDVPGMSQSTHVTTDLTVNSATSVPLPSEDTCYGQSATAPCRLLPALTLNYQLATDLSATSDLPVQSLKLGVSHISFDSAQSHAAITSAAVSVSFDGGKTWQPATLKGSGCEYTATWANPVSAKGTSPALKVTATDAIGGSITQTIANAYTIAK